MEILLWDFPFIHSECCFHQIIPRNSNYRRRVCKLPLNIFLIYFWALLYHLLFMYYIYSNLLLNYHPYRTCINGIGNEKKTLLPCCYNIVSWSIKQSGLIINHRCGSPVPQMWFSYSTDVVQLFHWCGSAIPQSWFSISTL